MKTEPVPAPVNTRLTEAPTAQPGLYVAQLSAWRGRRQLTSYVGIVTAPEADAAIHLQMELAVHFHHEDGITYDRLEIDNLSRVRQDAIDRCATPTPAPEPLTGLCWALTERTPCPLNTSLIGIFEHSFLPDHPCDFIASYKNEGDDAIYDIKVPGKTRGIRAVVPPRAWIMPPKFAKPPTAAAKGGAA